MRIRTPRPVAFALALVLALGAAACSRDKPSSEQEAESSPTPDAAVSAGFKATAVQAVDAGDRPQAGEKAKQVAPQVVDLVNAYYEVAFLEPGKWANGQHTGLADLFTGDVRGQIGPQLQGLALGDLAPRIESVKPDRQEVHVKAYVTGNELSVPLVAVDAYFEGTGEPKEEADGPVRISHTLKAFAIPEGNGFKIAGGTADLKADTAAGALGPVGRSAVLQGVQR